jgi:membrane protein DedA with SNARE-associated domain
MAGLITHYGLALIFANVLIQQLGLPIPAAPTLIVAGALAAVGSSSALAMFGVACAACWIAAGYEVQSGSVASVAGASIHGVSPA